MKKRHSRTMTGTTAVLVAMLLGLVPMLLAAVANDDHEGSEESDGTVEEDGTTTMSEPDDSAAEFQEAARAAIWQGMADARAVAPIVGIPGELAPTVPFARSIIEATPGRSESLTGLFYGSEVAEEGVLNTTGGDRGNTRPVNPFLIRCHNPDQGTGTTVDYAPIEQAGYSIVSASKLPASGADLASGTAEGVFNSSEVREQVETLIDQFDENFAPVVQDFGLQAAEAGDGTTMPDGFPDAHANCENRFVAWAESNTGVNLSGALELGGTTRTHTAYDPESTTTTSHVLSEFVGLDLAGVVKIKAFSSEVQVTKTSGEDPTVDFETVLAGVSGGQDADQILGVSGEGIRIAGSDILPEDVVDDFATQLGEQSEALEELATFGLVLAEPEVEETDSGIVVHAPALEFLVRPGPAANELDNVETPEVEQPEFLPFSVPFLQGGNLPARVGQGRIGDVVGVRLGGAEVQAVAEELPNFSLGLPGGVSSTGLAAGGPDQAPGPSAGDVESNPANPLPSADAGVAAPPPTLTGSPADSGSTTVDEPGPTPTANAPSVAESAPADGDVTSSTPSGQPEPFAGGPAAASGSPVGKELADAWLWLSIVAVVAAAGVPALARRVRG